MKHHPQSNCAHLTCECERANVCSRWLYGCPGVEVVVAGMFSAVRRLLIGCFRLLSAGLYCCSSQRKSRGEAIISQLSPTRLISHHSLPRALIYRRVNFFSLFSLFWVTNSLFSPPPLPDGMVLSPLFHNGRVGLSVFERGRRRRELKRGSGCCLIPRRRW